MDRAIYKEAFLTKCASVGAGKEDLLPLVKSGITEIFTKPLEVGGKVITKGLDIGWDAVKSAPGWAAGIGAAGGGTAYLLHRKLMADKEEYERRKRKIHKMIQLKEQLGATIV